MITPTPEQIDAIYTQYHGHAQQISGAWSVSEDTARALAGDSYDDAADYAEDKISDDAAAYAASEIVMRARMYSDDGIELEPEQRDAIELRIYDEYKADYYDSERPSYNAYFWHYLIKQIEEAQR